MGAPKNSPQMTSLLHFMEVSRTCSNFMFVRTESSDLTSVSDDLSVDIQRGASGLRTFTIRTRNDGFGNVLVFGGDSTKRIAMFVFYASGGCIVTPLISNIYTWTASFDSATKTLSLTADGVIYGGLTFVQ